MVKSEHFFTPYDLAPLYFLSSFGHQTTTAHSKLADDLERLNIIHSRSNVKVFFTFDSVCYYAQHHCQIVPLPQCPYRNCNTDRLDYPLKRKTEMQSE
jgi:hypothetical protein